MHSKVNQVKWFHIYLALSLYVQIKCTMIKRKVESFRAQTFSAGCSRTIDLCVCVCMNVKWWNGQTICMCRIKQCRLSTNRMPFGCLCLLLLLSWYYLQCLLRYFKSYLVIVFRLLFLLRFFFSLQLFFNISHSTKQKRDHHFQLIHPSHIFWLRFAGTHTHNHANESRLCYKYEKTH